MAPASRAFLYLLFALSGAAGLIYESVWSHYLGLWLGHAAYAQALVLSIYMGGLALGAWLAGRWQVRTESLLLAYAILELLIAAAGFAFHSVYVQLTDVVRTELIPHISAPVGITLLRWLTGAVLILPQAVLLGMTFPYFTGGLVRLVPNNAGRVVATAYFANSFGAAVGVLIAGFVLVENYGLPGAMRSAAIVNILVAIGIGLTARGRPAQARVAVARRPTALPLVRLLIMASLLTGFASFLYELVWIRLLNMVLGGSVHSFELMLSAFILGLAIGGFTVRRRVDQFEDTVLVLAVVQMAMGVLAISTLAFYDVSYELMAHLIGMLARTDAGYTGFLVGSHAIALLIMLPATICAGMTLPLITRHWMSSGGGEASVGNTYSANTVGAILGVVIGMLVLIPYLGLRWTLGLGAAIDFGLGLVLLRHAWDFPPGRTLAACAMATCYMVVALGLFDVDPRRMASGVYRSGRAQIDDGEVIYHRDGRTASISVTEYGSYRVLATNGKPDASMELNQAAESSGDEGTQVLTAAIPMMLHPDAREVAVIGFGSGTSSAIVLANPAMAHVTTIEIEPVVVEAAKFFLPWVAATYQDPRSSIVIEDARAWFTQHPGSYDLIIAEPSNPWVNGVASLFTQEFYALVEQALAADGVFAQWLQLYEIDTPLVATVIRALTGRFPRVEIYELRDGNLLLLASQQASLAAQPERLMSIPLLAERLARVDIHHADDLLALRLGSGAVFAPLISALAVAANSDFHPVLERGSARSRFLRRDAYEIARLATAPLPVIEMLDTARPVPADGRALPDATGDDYRSAYQHALARAVLAAAQDRDDPVGQTLDAGFVHILGYLRGEAAACGSIDNSEWLNAVVQIAGEVLPFLSHTDGQALIDRLLPAACDAGSLPIWRSLLGAVAARDAPTMAVVGTALVQTPGRELSDAQLRYVVLTAMLGYLASDRPAAARELWEGLSPAQRRGMQDQLVVRLLVAHAGG